MPKIVKPGEAIVTVPFSCPPALKEEIDAAAAQDEMNRSAFICSELRRALRRRRRRRKKN